MNKKAILAMAYLLNSNIDASILPAQDYSLNKDYIGELESNIERIKSEEEQDKKEGKFEEMARKVYNLSFGRREFIKRIMQTILEIEIIDPQEIIRNNSISEYGNINIIYENNRILFDLLEK